VHAGGHSFAFERIPVHVGVLPKDEILHQVHLSGHDGLWLAAAGAFLISVYSFRLVFVVFFAPIAAAPGLWRRPRPGAPAPLAVLLLLSIAAGSYLPLTGVVPAPPPLGAADAGGWCRGRRLPVIVAVARESPSPGCCS